LIRTPIPIAGAAPPPLQADPGAGAIANLITLLSLCLGLTAIRVAVEGKFELAIAAIVSAAILDGLMAVSRVFCRAPRASAPKLDSLADFVNFGVAPAIVLYFWGLSALRSAGWIAALVFAICTSLRLARFTLCSTSPTSRPMPKFLRRRSGAGRALIVMLPVYLELIGLPRTGVSPVLAAPLHGRNCAPHGVVAAHLVGKARLRPRAARLCAADFRPWSCSW